MALENAELRALGAACFEIAVVREGRAQQQHRQHKQGDAREEESEEGGGGAWGAEEAAFRPETAKKFTLRDLVGHLDAVFVAHVGPSLDPVHIARLAVTCKWDRERTKIMMPVLVTRKWDREFGLWGVRERTKMPFLGESRSRLGRAFRSESAPQDSVTERLYRQVCERLGFRQTGSRSRPVPWVQIYAQHLCTECWQPAVSTGSVHVDLNGGSHAGGVYAAQEAVKWVCGDCCKAVAGLRSRLQKSELMRRGLPHTARRFDDGIRRKILHAMTGC